MSKKDSEDQKKSMSAMFRGRAIFKPLNTGWIDERVACVREWVANIFFYTKNGTTIMIDAGYNYDRLREKMGWLDIDPASIEHILITHQDTDHVGALETDSEGLFRNAAVYIGEIEDRYLSGEKRRRVLHGLCRLPPVKTDNKRVLLRDGQILDIDGIRIECILCPGHTWGHMVYLIDDETLFTGDTIWLGRRLQLPLRAGRGQQAGGPVPGRAGKAAARPQGAHQNHHRPHRLDGRSGFRLPPQEGDLQALHEEIYRPGSAL